MRVLVLLVAALVEAAARVGASGACAAENLSQNRVYAACSDLPTLGASVHWTYDPETSSLSVAFVAAPLSASGWVAWGLNPTGDGMAGTQALIAAPKGGGGAYGVQTYDIQGASLGSPGRIAYPTSDLAAVLGGDGRVQMFGKLTLHNGTGEVNQVWQMGQVLGGSIAVHAMAAGNMGAKGKLNLVTGAATRGSSNLLKKKTHGILNAVSWGILLPIGGIVARYLKTFKSAEPAWLYLHIACQLMAYMMGLCGFPIGIDLGNLSKGITYLSHRNMGIVVLAIGTLQIVALVLKPNKDHKLRVYWNLYHHSAGYAIIVLGIVNVFKGMTILNVGEKLKTGYIITIGILTGIAVALEVITCSIAWECSIVVQRRNTKDKAPSGPAYNGRLPLSI
ncbi:cytochrome b561 and DOMON domain-containing protein At4g12980-like [Hordeum vulgare subsp. vulgare]|uniref:cytochrome b561 and DOMON domain-containing protein At4g12980-like n=1 Tax=Hordeum vulgare subsp. vulgare TaxID=112509 RepID=UPI000B47BD67|nr:cytochrome b561 and DOMON domain-containing protein At4g12980-like [Hordeum vulgare subsp. vulgare]